MSIYFPFLLFFVPYSNQFTLCSPLIFSMHQTLIRSTLKNPLFIATKNAFIAFSGIIFSCLHWLNFSYGCRCQIVVDNICQLSPCETFWVGFQTHSLLARAEKCSCANPAKNCLVRLQFRSMKKIHTRKGS